MATIHSKTEGAPDLASSNLDSTVPAGENDESVRLGQSPRLRDVSRCAAILPFFDIALIWLSLLVVVCGFEIFSHLLRLSYFFSSQQVKFVGLLLVNSLFIVVLARAQGLYSGTWRRTFQEEFLSIGKCILSSFAVISAAMYFEGSSLASFAIAGLTLVVSWVAMTGWRRFLRAQSIPGLTERRNIVIVGAGRLGLRLRKHVENNPELGFVFCGFVDRRWKIRTESGTETEALTFLGKVDELPAIARAHFIDEIFVSLPGDRYLIREVSIYARQAGVSLRVVPEVSEDQELDLPVEYVGAFPTMTLQEAYIPTLQLIFKRLFDIVWSSTVLLLLSPLLVVVAALIKFDTKGPVLYRSLRVGRKGKTFVCFKFRTMVVDAEELKASLEHLNERDNILFKISKDPRITRLGQFLRKFSVDEFPQLFNVHHWRSEPAGWLRHAE